VDRANNEHLLERLSDLPLAERTARFVCVAALVDGSGGEHIFRGEAPGLILGRPRGWEGFGYDPLFLDRELGKTFGELTRAEKQARSHRGRAFLALADHLTSTTVPGSGS
jgi:XTP/dITP diphosphohydrolase